MNSLDVKRFAIAHGWHAAIGVVLGADVRIFLFAVAPDGILPESPVHSLVPLWKLLPASTPANTETGPLSGPGFLLASRYRSAKARDVVGEIGDFRVADGRKHRSHHAVIAMADVVPVFAQRLHQKILALI